MKENDDNDLFWSHPLGFWLHDCASLIPETEWRSEHSRNCQDIHLDEILDGLLLTSLMRYIDSTHQTFSENGKNDKRRIPFQSLLTQISRFYEEHLEQVIVCRLPDLEVLDSVEEYNENTQEELRKLLLLLLGCAIQSDKKKIFVERITQFDQKIQAELADYIQKLTESDDIIQNLEDFRRIEMKDRDIEMATTTAGSVEDADSDDLESSTTTSSNGETCIKQQKEQSFLMNRSTSPTSELRHMSLQNANLQHEMRQMRTQAENRDEECRRLELENEEKSQKINILENEKLKLLDYKKKFKSLNDDLQEANCKIEKYHHLADVEKKYKEAKDGKDHFKSRYEAVTKNYHTLEDTCAELEKQNRNLQLELSQKSGIEEQIHRLKNTINELETEVSTKRTEMEDFLDEKYRLERELKEAKDRVQQLEMPSTTTTPRFIDSLADQLEDAKKDEYELMKAEIRKLRAQTEGATPDTTIHQSAFDLEALRSELCAEQHKTAELQLEIQKMKADKDQIDGTMERIAIEMDETANHVAAVNQERDEAVKQLLEARRKFSEFQTEFGKKSEEQLQNLLGKLGEEQEKSRKLAENLRVQSSSLEDSELQVAKLKDDLKKVEFELDETRESLNCSSKNWNQDKNCLKSKVLELQDIIESQKLDLLNQNSSKKRLEDRDSLIATLQSEKIDMENDLKTCQTHLELESKKLQRLREDLVLEKSRRADLIGRLHSLCTTLSLNGANFEKIDNDDELIDNIDDIMMNALVAVKRERDDLRIQGNQQIQELNDLKRDIEKLRRSESESLNESDDRVRELTKENMHTKEQVFLLQEKLRELSLELSTKNNEIEIAKTSIEELNRNSSSSNSNNAEIARLQVSIRNSQIQEELVKQENSKMRDEIQDLQKAMKKRAHNLDELENMHKALLVDHSRLQQLHSLLTRDYDEAKKESQELRQKVQNIPRQQAIFMNANIRELEAKLTEEISQREKMNRKYLELEKEHKMCGIHRENLRRDIAELVQTRDELSMDLHRARDTCHNKSNQLDELKKQVSQKLAEISKLNAENDALSQLKRTYADENKNLSRQLEILYTQNKELLQRALHDKDQYHLEMKDFQDQLSALRRHKEKLEDKIMDQYRTMENKKSTPDRKQPLVKRAAKALISRRRATSNGGSTTEDSSVYSADERGSPPLAGAHDDNDTLPPTCSSSDDHEVVSPDLNAKPALLRSRNDFLGGSVRMPSGSRLRNGNDYENGSFVTSLPPRVPIRNSPMTSSLRLRPPPPPYSHRSTTHSLRSGQHTKLSSNTEELCATTNYTSFFEPMAHSTPNSSVLEERKVVGEGEKREVIMDKGERVDKTLSYYENVNLPQTVTSSELSAETGDLKPNESTIWYEYGCV